MRRSAAAWLGRGAGGPAADGSGALIRHPAMDDWVRRVCAVHADGRCLIAEGRESDRRLRAALLALRRDGNVPASLTEQTASLDEIAECWRAADRAQGAHALRGGRRGQGKRHRIRERQRPLPGPRHRQRPQAPARRTSSRRRGPRGHGLPLPLQGRGLGPDLLPAERLPGFFRPRRRPGAASRHRLRAPLPARPHEPDGDHLFARLFYRDRIERGTTLESLGFSDEEAEVFSEIRMSLRGGIFLGGSAGDGKSTTLATNLALQMEEAEGQLNVVTIEDPVEYPIPGAVQIAVPTTGSGEERGKHFRDALMHFCRVHPASGMVSEIRDADAARQVLQFIDTGHQVWTTIHVHSANAILFRLLDMGVGTAEVCKPGNIELLMKQTLLPRLCDGCALEAPAGEREVPAWLNRHIGNWPLVRFRNPEGCDACNREDRSAVAGKAWNGYVRQIAIAEAIRPDAAYLSFVRQRDPGGAWEHWVTAMGGRPIGGRIWTLVAAGKADPFDALRKGARTEQAASVDPPAVADAGDGAP